MSESRDLGLVTDPSLGIIIWVLGNGVGGPVSRMFFLSEDSEPLLMVPVGSLRQGDLGRNKRMFIGGRQLRRNNTEEPSL